MWKMQSFFVSCLILCSLHLVFGGGSNCYDQDENCPRLSMQGNCFKNKELRRKCPDSCGVCQTDEENEILRSIQVSADHTVWFMKMLVCFFICAVFVAIVKMRNTGGVCLSKGNMKDKLVIITGATSGIGLDTAFHLALRGAKVIIGCRNLKNGFKAAKDLRAQTGQKMIEVRKLDLASFDSIRDFANIVTDQFSKIDVLINNAGVYSGKNRTFSLDGHESTFQSNYLGHFYLTKLLMKKLRDSSPSRIINVVSEDFKKGGLDFANLQGHRNFNNAKAYSNANLALMYFTKQLSDLLKGTGVTVNAANPGISCTNLWRDIFPYGWNLTWILLSPYTYLFWKSSSMGAETSYYCALDRDLEKVSGKYFKDCKEEEFPDLEDEVGRKLWAVSERLLEPKKLSTLNQAAIKRALNDIARAEAAAPNQHEASDQPADSDNIDSVNSHETKSDDDNRKSENGDPKTATKKKKPVEQDEKVTETSRKNGSIRNRKVVENKKKKDGKSKDIKKSK